MAFTETDLRLEISGARHVGVVALQCADREYSGRILQFAVDKKPHLTTRLKRCISRCVATRNGSILWTFVMLEHMLTSKGIRVTCLGDALVRTPLNFLVSHG